MPHDAPPPSQGSLVPVATPLGEQLSLRVDAAITTLPPPQVDRTWRKAVRAIHSYPLNGEQNIVTRKLLNALVVHAQDVFAQMSPSDRQTLKAVRGTPLFRLSLRRLVVLMGWQESKNYNRLYEALETIYRWQIRWDLMEDSPEGMQLVEEISGRIISQWGKSPGDRSGGGYVSYEFPHDTLMMLLEPHPYAQIDLRVVHAMGSSYAIALYELCARYLGTVNKVTAVLPLEKLIAIIAGEGKYNNDYKLFNRYCLRPAGEMLARVESCPFTVEPIPTFGPRRKIRALQFRMHLKGGVDDKLDVPPTWDPRTVEQLRRVYRMSLQDIGLLARTATEADVLEAMKRDTQMIARKTASGETVTNRAAYLKGIVRNVAAGRPATEEPEEDAGETVSRPVLQAVQQVEKKRTEFEDFRALRLQDYLQGLPSEELVALRADFAQARGAETLIGRWLAAGWAPPHSGLLATFARWVLTERPALSGRLLVKPDETEFSVWLLLNTGGQK